MARQSSKMLIPYGDPLLRILILYDTCSLAKIDSGLIFDVILDDRNERAGVKFNDMDLIGAYARVTYGRGAAKGLAELQF